MLLWCYNLIRIRKMDKIVNFPIRFAGRNLKLLDYYKKEAEATGRSAGALMRIVLEQHKDNEDAKRKAFLDGAKSAVKACNDAQDIMDK